MHAAADTNLEAVASELRFIRRHVQTIECTRGDDFECVDQIVLSVNEALAALEAHALSLSPDATDDLSLPEAA